MTECEEPRCTRQATRDWNGMKVCADHFEAHREQLDRVRSELG